MKCVLAFSFSIVILFGLGCQGVLTKEEATLLTKHCKKCQSEFQTAVDAGTYKGMEDGEDLIKAIKARHEQAIKLLEEATNSKK